MYFQPIPERVLRFLDFLFVFRTVPGENAVLAYPPLKCPSSFAPPPLDLSRDPSPNTTDLMSLPLAVNVLALTHPLLLGLRLTLCGHVSHTSLALIVSPSGYFHVHGRLGLF